MAGGDADGAGGVGGGAGGVPAGGAEEADPASAASGSSVEAELATIGSMAPHDLQKRRVASFASPQSGH